LILYADTSALVKLYIDEPGRPLVVTSVERAMGAVVTARVSYAEARAALARYQRTGELTRSELRRIVNDLDRDWESYSIVEITPALVRRAGTLAERHALRGYDAVQLACALDTRDAGAEVDFLSFDDDLNRAARRERLTLPRSTPPR
jgi:predicted nucleic acid-binding protein